MNKKEVFTEIESLFGMVPTFMKNTPEDTLAEEWVLMRKLVVEEKHIPHKYKELIGIGVAAATKCQYCIFFHTQLAILFGANENEIEEAIHYSKNSSGWSTYLNGLNLDLNTFKDEVRQMVAFVKDGHAAHA